jgi:hypothetical protein
LPPQSDQLRGKSVSQPPLSCSAPDIPCRAQLLSWAARSSGHPRDRQPRVALAGSASERKSPRRTAIGSTDQCGASGKWTLRNGRFRVNLASFSRLPRDVISRVACLLRRAQAASARRASPASSWVRTSAIPAEECLRWPPRAFPNKLPHRADTNQEVKGERRAPPPVFGHLGVASSNHEDARGNG